MRVHAISYSAETTSKAFPMALQTMYRHTVFLSCLVLLLSSTGCYPSPSPLPTIGPVRGGGSRTEARFELFASTNCAAVGETVTFTLIITSTSTQPVTITGSPLLEITLEPRGRPSEEPPPIRRWSETDQYPPQIDPVILPGEQRTYTWDWIAEPVYAERGVRGVNAEVFTTIDDHGIDQGIGGDVYLGVGSFNHPGMGELGLPCTEMAPGT